MEPEGSLSYSQEPATGPYPEIDEFSSHPHKMRFNVFLPTTVKRPGSEPDNSAPSSAEVKNAWCHTSIPPIISIDRC